MKTKTMTILTLLLIVMQLNRAGAQEFDMDIYPPDSLKGKGILVRKDIKKEGMYDEQWWLSEGDFSLHADMVEYGEKIVLLFDREHPNGYSKVSRDYEMDIPAGPFRVCRQDDEHYFISSRYPKQRSMCVREFPGPPSLRVRKSEMDSLGFQFISCEQLVARHKSRHTQSPVGLHILPPIQVVTPEPAQDGAGGFWSPYPSFVLFIVRTSASLDAPFISIVEPCPKGYGQRGHYQCEVLSRSGYWYELKVKFGFMYGGVFWDGFYDGGTYTGYWQAPFDEAGFPYALVDMIEPRYWPYEIRELESV